MILADYQRHPILTTVRPAIIPPNYMVNHTIFQWSWKRQSDSNFQKGNNIFISVVDLGEGPASSPPPLVWGNREEMTEGKPAGQVKQNPPLHFTKYVLTFLLIIMITCNVSLGNAFFYFDLFCMLIIGNAWWWRYRVWNNVTAMLSTIKLTICGYYNFG